ncbi:MAG: LacI family DNA-binding transcriptional regulator, partial [Ktedonobacteraceae bacterium]|nr:LacI family DNA-binding transcriptional regulator [Ktedonobacteraceae bacterium]
TRARVMKYVQELGYQPNLVARSLIKGRTGLIGLVVPRLENPFYAEIVTAVERLAYAAGRRIFVNTLSSDDEFGQQMLRDLASRRVEGILAMAGSISINSLLNSIDLPAVYCLDEAEDEPLLPSVSFDFTQGGQLAAEHLVSLGHRRFGIVTSKWGVGEVGHLVRIEGFKKVLAEHGLEILPEHIQAGQDRLMEGKAAGYRLLTQPDPPTAIFAVNDLMAIGVISVAWELGLRVPQDLSVVGFDDIMLGQYLTPPLTTIVIDKDALMTQALELLLRAIESQETITSPPLLPARLVIRGSTGPAQHD